MTKNLMGIPRSDELPPLREPQESLEDESWLPGPPPGLCPGSAELGLREVRSGPVQHYTSCDLQTSYSGKNISILMRKLRGKWVEIVKNSGKARGK